jgi:hypothetical protein
LPPTQGPETFRACPFGSDGIVRDIWQGENQWKDHPFVRIGWERLVRENITKLTLTYVFNYFFSKKAVVALVLQLTTGL